MNNRPFPRCRSINEHYEKINRIEEGTYGIVYRARDRQTGETVALKKIKLERERDGFPVTSLREINALFHLRPHRHIVNVREMVVGERLDSVYIVMDFVDYDVRTILDEFGPFPVSETKTLLAQLLSALALLHQNWIIHRDLKTSNLLITNDGQIKVADFGLARKLGSPLRPEDPLTKGVVTLWYRPPELLLGATEYDGSVDAWSAGCIFGELLGREPLFPGSSEIDQLHRIFSLLGTPTKRTWPDFNKLPHSDKITLRSDNSNSRNRLQKKYPMLSSCGIDLLIRLLTLDPKQRIGAAEALQHPFFTENPLPKDPSHFPNWPSKFPLPSSLSSPSSL